MTSSLYFSFANQYSLGVGFSFPIVLVPRYKLSLCHTLIKPDLLGFLGIGVFACELRDRVITRCVSRRYVLLHTRNTRLLGFEYVKELYDNDSDFAVIYNACGHLAFGKFYLMDDYLFKKNKLCVPTSSLRELLVRKAYGGGLMGLFGEPWMFCMSISIGQR